MSARTAYSPPAGMDPKIARIIEALAKKMAREDHERDLAAEGATHDRTRGDIRPLFERPTD